MWHSHLNEFPNISIIYVDHEMRHEGIRSFKIKTSQYFIDQTKPQETTDCDDDLFEY